MSLYIIFSGKFIFVCWHDASYLPPLNPQSSGDSSRASYGQAGVCLSCSLFDCGWSLNQSTKRNGTYAICQSVSLSVMYKHTHAHKVEKKEEEEEGNHNCSSRTGQCHISLSVQIIHLQLIHCINWMERSASAWSNKLLLKSYLMDLKQRFMSGHYWATACFHSLPGGKDAATCCENF